MRLKKLLVLDVNGLLIDTYFYKKALPEAPPDAKIGNFYVYKRPFCDEFVQFCLDNFVVGTWSSAREYNVNNLVDYIFGEAKDKLAFSWHQSQCTDVGLKAPDNEHKPLFLKDLSKLWKKEKLDLPWSRGDYGPSNTLLVDDTPYKAFLNPPNTAIFPRPYSVLQYRDNFLGGALRRYLERIRDAADVQTFVEKNPFGEPSITPESPLWSHVSKVLLKVQNVLDTLSNGVAQVSPLQAVCDDVYQDNGKRNMKDDKKGDGHVTSHLTKDTMQPCDAFPFRALALQSSWNVGPSRNNKVHSEVLHAFHKESGDTHQREKDVRVSARPHKGDQLRLAHTHHASDKMYQKSDVNRQNRPSLHHEDQALKDVVVECMKIKQPCRGEETKKARTHKSKIDGEHNHLHEKQGKEIDAPEEIINDNTCLSSLKTEAMQVGTNKGLYHEKHPWTNERKNVVTAYGNQLLCYRRRKRLGNQKDYQSKDTVAYSQRLKRHKEFYQDDGRNDYYCGQSVIRGKGSSHEKHRDSLDYSQTAKREEQRFYPENGILSLNGDNEEIFFRDSGNLFLENNETCAIRDTSLDSCIYYRRRPKDRQIQKSAEHFWSCNRTSPTRSTDTTCITQSHRSWGTVGTASPCMNAFDEHGFTSSRHGQSGFDTKMPYIASNPHANAAGDWNLAGWHFKQTRPHVQSGFDTKMPHIASNPHANAAGDWNLAGWHFERTRWDGRGQSYSCRGRGMHSQSYDKGSGALGRPYRSYRSKETSMHEHHGRNYVRRKRWSPSNYPTSKQS